MNNNPYIYGDPVPSEKFINRENEIRTILNRVIPNFQSTAIIGEPKSGKSSLLRYLFAEETHKKLFRSFSGKITFSLVDAHSFGETMTQSQFWERCLYPLKQKIDNSSQAHPLQDAFRTCVQNNFGSFVLERLFMQMASSNQYLLIGIDEFDTLLDHPILNKAEFFGGLRSLTSNHRSLALILASRQHLASLNVNTQEFSRTGSPYFNILLEIVLGKFDVTAIEKILKFGKKRFSMDDKRFIRSISGDHPYLAQAVSALLWNEYEGRIKKNNKRREKAADSLFDIASPIFKDIWRHWSPETKKAFTTIALDDMPTILQQRSFDINFLIKDLPNYQSELRILYKQGFITPDKQLESEWKICPDIYAWCLADELISVVRDDKKFDLWFQAQEWEGFFKRGEKEQLAKAGGYLASLLKEGLTTFFKGSAERLAKIL